MRVCSVVRVLCARRGFALAPCVRRRLERSRDGSERAEVGALAVDQLVHLDSFGVVALVVAVAVEPAAFGSEVRCATTVAAAVFEDGFARGRSHRAFLSTAAWQPFAL